MKETEIMIKANISLEAIDTAIKNLMLLVAKGEYPEGDIVQDLAEISHLKDQASADIALLCQAKRIRPSTDHIIETNGRIIVSIDGNGIK